MIEIRPLLLAGDSELFKLLLVALFIALSGFAKLVEWLAKKRRENARARPGEPQAQAPTSMTQTDLEDRVKRLLREAQSRAPAEPVARPAPHAPQLPRAPQPSHPAAQPAPRPPKPVRLEPVRPRVAPPAPSPVMAAAKSASRDVDLVAKGREILRRRRGATPYRATAPSRPLDPRVLVRSREGLRAALVLREILGKPVGLR